MSFTFVDGPIAECRVNDHVKVIRSGEKGVIARTGRGITGKPIIKVLLSDGKDKGRVVELNPKQVHIETKTYEIKETVRPAKPAQLPPVETPKQSKMEELFTAELFATDEAVAEHVEKKARRDKLARLIKVCYALDDAAVEVGEEDDIPAEFASAAFIVCSLAEWNKFVDAVTKIDTP